MSREIKGLFCYLFSWLGGLIIYLVEKEDELIRFHAVQSMVASGLIFVIQVAYGILPLHIPFFSSAIGIIGFIIWIIGCIKGYKLEKYKFPIIGDIAENIIDKSKEEKHE
ncbi:MAG: DUF4870 domain-containing protein [Bacillota bacterium]|nr:DUF4870 domain-containing protein [Bacillota bacterium]